MNYTCFSTLRKLGRLLRERLLVVCCLLLVLAGTARAQEAVDTVQAGRFDKGKMWTFEDPPLAYLEETYGLRPDAAWLEQARLSALRLPGCSAAFVSPNGLVATNHHCARGSVLKVTRPGENLLDEGFYARTLDEERPVEDYYVDQLVAIEDVTAEVEAALSGAETAAERAAARREAMAAVEGRLAEAAGLHVEVVSLYSGGRYSAYTFRRYTDVRLVMAPELQLGYFGGDPDNFTYPRYALDVAFLRVYGSDGRPLATDHYFAWSREGVQEGDLVFVIGNPGSTSRLETVAQLEFRRDVQVETMLRFLDSRIAVLEAYQEAASEDAVRNDLFSLLNAQKAYRGRREALHDPVIMARLGDAERQFREAIARDPELQAAYGDLFDRMAEVQRQKGELGAAYRAFWMLASPRFGSATLNRALLAWQLLTRRQAGAAPEALTELEEQVRRIGDRPRRLEQQQLSVQIGELQQYFAEQGEPLPAALRGASPEDIAGQVLAGTVLADSAQAAQALAAGTLSAQDPALALVDAFMPHYIDFGSAFAGLTAQEEELGSRLGRARFEVYGTAVPPDATFSLRFTDGVVRGYPYNGTVAPPYTTFYGLYDHYYSYGPGTPWDLPARWISPPAAFDRSTPLNFVSTADTIGGNSGSPVVNRNLELVGINFDRTIEGLSRDYIYLPDRGRNVSVDARGVLEALAHLYDLERIVLELASGQLVPGEAEAVPAN